MEIGIFQLLPQPQTVSEREVIEQALWEADFADTAGFDSVWVTEHHASRFGLIGAPSAYAAAIAQRTRRVKIGYAVAVVPLHHPLRLAEEILWLSHLSDGRLLVGVGPGFSGYEFAAFGVALEERRERLEEGLKIIRDVLESPRVSHAGKHWVIPSVTPKPRPYGSSPPLLLRACSSLESLRRAAEEGMPVLLGLKPMSEIAEYVALYRRIRAERGRSRAEIDKEVEAIRVLRRVCLGETDTEALEPTRRALVWEHEVARSVHGPAPHPSPTLADGSSSGEGPAIVGGCVGTPATVLAGLEEVRALGIRHVIAWVNFGNMPYPRVRASMELLARHVLPKLAEPRPEDDQVAAGGR